MSHQKSVSRRLDGALETIKFRILVHDSISATFLHRLCKPYEVTFHAIFECSENGDKGTGNSDSEEKIFIWIMKRMVT